MVSTYKLTSLDSCGDFVCFGTESGGVGLNLAGRAFTIKPHNMQVTRTIFTGSKSSPMLVSAAKDGTVRMTDLVQQYVTLQYSWDQSFNGKQWVNWLEERGAYSYALDSGEEINSISSKFPRLILLIVKIF